MNVFFVGDELVAGKGDPRALGWTGRVAARTLTDEHDYTFHSLAIPTETTAELAGRWDEEVVRRIKGPDRNAVVFGIGRNDVLQHVTSTRTRMNIGASLDKARDLGFKTMVVGPPPGPPVANHAIAELAEVCRETAERRQVPYVDCYGPLVAHEQWLTDMASSPEALPGQAGYGLMAWLVLHSGWREWLELPGDH